MDKFIIGLWIGGFVGLFIAAMAQAAGKNEDENKREWIEYKCRINEKSGCNDVCCRECEKFNECSFKCEGNPEKCGQAYIKLR